MSAETLPTAVDSSEARKPELSEALRTCNGRVLGLKWHSCVTFSKAWEAKKNMEETGDGEMSSGNTASGPDTPTILMNTLQLWLAIQDPQKTEPSTCPHR